jgi:peptidoglycan/LPS O-acetylase OafA/YrhL
MIQAPKTDAGRYYRPELDVVRFLAFMLVFLYHAICTTGDPRCSSVFKSYVPVVYAFAHACRFGLSLFFTLSAFLICELLLRERDATGTVHVKQFYIRRILRIWPLYYLGLLIGLAYAFLPGNDRNAVVEMGWFAIFMGSWYVVSHAIAVSPMSVLWSISVEEQFYLFAPWIAKYFSRRSLYGFCAVVLLMANGCLYSLGKAQAPDSSIWFNSLIQFECFAAGILLCLVLHGRLPAILLWQRLMLVAACAICWFFACYGLHSVFNSPSENPGSWPLIGGYALASLGCVLVMVAFLGINPRMLPGPVIYLGRISFGLYVYHELALDIIKRLPIGHAASFASPLSWLKAASTLGLTILMASLSYRYFETPFLKLKKRHAVIESQPIGG